MAKRHQISPRLTRSIIARTGFFEFLTNQEGLLGTAFELWAKIHSMTENIRLRRVGAEFSASAPLLMSNLPGYNPVAGPCTIRVKKTKPWKVISPLRHTAASILHALAFGWLVLPGIFSFADA